MRSDGMRPAAANPAGTAVSGVASRELPCRSCRLRHASAFGCLGPKDLSALEQSKRVVTFRRGQVVFHEGAAPAAAYCVYSGRVRLCKLGIEGRLQVVRTVGPGGLFGHQAILSGRPYPATASVASDTVLCRIDKPSLLRLLGGSHPLALQLTRRLSLDVIRAEAGLHSMANTPAPERMAKLLLDLFAEAEGPFQGAAQISVPRQTLAEAAGIATETAIRILTRFKARGLIASKGRRLLLADPDGLRSLAGPDA